MEYTALAREVRTNLESLKHNLRIAYAGIVVAAEALKCQAADHDPEVAEVLNYCVGSRVYQQIERVEAFLESLNPGTSGDRGEAGVEELEALQ